MLLLVFLLLLLLVAGVTPSLPLLLTLAPTQQAPPASRHSSLSALRFHPGVTCAQSRLLSGDCLQRTKAAALVAGPLLLLLPRAGGLKHPLLLLLLEWQLTLC
jgi:hypothetical protein